MHNRRNKITILFLLLCTALCAGLIACTHTHEFVTNVTPPTCTEQGYTTYTCACGYSYESDYVAPDDTNHEYVWEKEIAPTCTESGIKAHYHCSECGMNFDENKNASSDLSLPAGHTYEWIDEIPAKCTENGTIGHFHCSGCGKNFDEYREELDNIVISAKGHDYGTWITEIPSKCTEEGTLGHYHCSDCEKNFDENKEELYSLIIEAGHRYENGVCTVCKEKKPSEGLNYYKNSNNTYTVTGIGTCKDTEIVIPALYNGLPVTSIGYYAFNDCAELTSVTIPNGVTKIESHAFCNCSKLTSITIPNGVTSIENNAFASCTELITVTIPDSVTAIGKSTFYGCTALISVTLGSGITEIDELTFALCSKLKSITIPNGVTSIGDNAFASCTELVTATIPNSVTLINQAAFFKCSSLTNVTIPNSVTDLGYMAFSGCTGLTSIAIPNSVTNLGNKVFFGCTGLTSVTIGSGITSLNNTFEGCTRLESIIIPDNVTTIGTHTFYGCTNLTSVTIGRGVTSIANYSFYDCIALAAVHYNATDCSVDGDMTHLFYTAEQSNNEIKVTIGANVKKIPAYLFYSKHASAYKPNITEIIFENGSVCESIGKYAFAYANITNITIPDSVTSIGEQTFKNCFNLKSMTLPFVGGSKTADSASKTTEFGYIFGTGSSFDHYDSAYSVNGHFIPVSLKSITITGGNILSEAFKNYQFTSITLPNNLTAIGNNAFEGCKALTDITIPTNVTSIGNYAFRNCTALTSVTMSNNVTAIGNYAFFNCTALETIHYVGTQEQWETITKGEKWDRYSESYYDLKINYTVNYSED